MRRTLDILLLHQVNYYVWHLDCMVYNILYTLKSEPVNMYFLFLVRLNSHHLLSIQNASTVTLFRADHPYGMMISPTIVDSPTPTSTHLIIMSEHHRLSPTSVYVGSVIMGADLETTHLIVSI